MARTRAIEILEAAKVPFEVKEFAATEFSAQEVTDKLGVPLEQVYKTLVAQGDKVGVVVAVVPGDRELNLKKLAAAIHDKRAEMAKLQDLQRLTGYLKGGCSPLGQRKQYPTFLDSAALEQQTISVSAGLRGVQVIIAPSDLVKVCGAQVVELT